MIYLSGKIIPELPAMKTPHIPNKLTGQVWAADSGRFSRPHQYSDKAYLKWLLEQPSKETCLFATAPDVVGNAGETLRLSLPMLQPIRECGYKVAFVAQDGLECLDIPWEHFDCLFIGGTTEWKLSSYAAIIVSEAKRRGKWVHMGRVNSLKRLRYAASIGCDSADGTIIAYGPDLYTNKVIEWVKIVNEEK